MRRAAAIQLASKYAGILITLAITAVLARLITPEEFGLLAIVTVFTAFFNMFADMGVSAAVVQFRELTEEDMGKLFTFSVFLAILLAGLFCAASVPISAFYGEGRLVPLSCFASLSLLFNALNMVPNGMMLRARDFASIGVRFVVATALSGGLGIALAAVGAGCYALIAQLVAQSLIVLVWNLIRRPVHHLSIHFMGPVRLIFSYSAFQMGFSFVNYFSRNLDNLVIGKVMGTSALGFYDKAYKLTTYPLSAFSGIIGSVIQPYMAEHQDDSDAIFACWMKAAKVLSLIGAPLTAVFFCASEEVIGLFYGPQWGDAAPLFHILSVAVYFQMVNNISGAFFQSAGRTDLMFRCGIATTLMTVAGLIAGIASGSLVGVCMGIAAAYCLHTLPVSIFLIKRTLGQHLSKLRAFIPEVAVCCAVCAICSLLPFFPASGMVVGLLAKVGVVCAAFLIGYALTGQLKHLRALLGR